MWEVRQSERHTREAWRYIVLHHLPTILPLNFSQVVANNTSIRESYRKGTKIIEITFRCTTNQNACFCGCRTSQNAGKCLVGSGTNYTIIYAGLGSSGNVSVSAFNQNKHTIQLDLASGTAKIDGGTSVTIGSFVNNNLPIFCFACNQAGSAALFSTIEIYSVKIGNRASYIPVRVGTTGYMYDSVSGRLFGNAGTGNFTYGNDV